MRVLQFTTLYSYLSAISIQSTARLKLTHYSRLVLVDENKADRTADGGHRGRKPGRPPVSSQPATASGVSPYTFGTQAPTFAHVAA